MPERIQRKRTKGWRMPEGAVYVGRGTKWGNPFAIREKGPFVNPRRTVQNAAEAVALFRQWYKFPVAVGPAIAELRGKDLACWCPLIDAEGNRVPCHADLLLEWANAPEGRP